MNLHITGSFIYTQKLNIMLNEELKKEFKKKDLELVSLKNLIPLHISSKVLKKIGYLCQAISKVEWSGVLFYSVKGTLAEFNNVEFTVEDIYLMDKGSAAYTEYELDDDLIDYRMSNPESLKWKIGHIHSHNTMRTFFSGTDMSELNDNSEFHNYYLSLIVNNFMDMTAKVAFRGETKGYICKDENGKPWTLQLTEPRSIMFTFDCDIKGEELIEVEENFTQRVSDILKKSEVKELEIVKRNSHAGGIDGTQWWKNYNHDGHTNFSDKTDKEMKDFNKSFSPTLFDDVDDTDPTEDFTRFLLRLGNDVIKEDTLEQALEDIQISDINYKDYTSSIMEQYAALYEKYWSDYMMTDMEGFVDTTEDVITLMEEHQDYFTYLIDITKSLKMMLNKLQKV